MDESEVQQNNMISNLPLLFANGYPTSLDKITELQLENFIPFMVQCSLGHINLQGKIDYSEPEWWPENVAFTIPFSKPKKFIGNWMEKMKEIVIICYQFHKSVFLLRFCNDLAAYEHASLRFINNYNSTTSLFDRRSNKLLVTFRNENMSYDQPQRSRKCLLHQKTKNGNQFVQDEQQMMVEPAPFDIYLCDNCDAELYSKEAILEHEKTCNLDDDVILCDTPEPIEENQMLDPQNNEQNELRIGFLLNFSLQSRETCKSNFGSAMPESFQDSCTNPSLNSLRAPVKDDSSFMILDKSKRLPRRNRAVHSLSRCPTIPLSSPAGQLLLRSTKTILTKEYLSERLDRVERFCHAPYLTKSTSKPKYLERKFTPNSNLHCTFKKPQEYNTHMYVFPRRQFSQKRRTENFLFLNSPLIKKCRPISVRLKKISDNEIKRKKVLRNAKLNIKLTRDTSRSSNWKISSTPSTEIIVDTIDLCTSDDDVDTADEACNNIIGSTTYSTIRSYCKAKSQVKLPPSMSSSSCDKNRIKSRFKKLKTRFNASEVTLIPIKKSTSNVTCSIKNEKLNTASSLAIKTVHALSAQPLLEDSKNVTSARLTSPASTENSISQPKPLQPSVFIFSNYVTSPLTLISANTSNEGVAQFNTVLPESSNFKTQNQENHLTNSTISNCSNSDTKKNSSIALSSNTSANEWLPHSSLNNTVRNVTTTSTISNIAHSRIVDKERTSRSLPLMQSYGSPSRIVSIDLTS